MPDVRVWETAIVPETKEWVCGEYKIKDAKNLKFTPVKDHPITQCIGVFGFKDKDFPTLIEYIQDMEKYYKEKLKKCEAK
ncbi:hypothetical protein phi1422_0072 [Bdellovibrio phage phi1422]|uniref:hypothetical protein n=1 Tax=Bdellovibrio phage phi1422 TaxID=1127515 RepID=UPI0002536D97|nr:hypothetical protein F395_gp72 [Bdellovibrio phage phi1422]AFC22592.1 hypothetical protein phi1422_0072 [Bdellovibrio phage phi1422]